jgi:hypothetical protein
VTVGFGKTRIHAETATLEVRASEIARPHPDDQLTVDGQIIVQGEPARRDLDRLVSTLHEIAAGLISLSRD